MLFFLIFIQIGLKSEKRCSPSAFLQIPRTTDRFKSRHFLVSKVYLCSTFFKTGIYYKAVLASSPLTVRWWCHCVSLASGNTIERKQIHRQIRATAMKFIVIKKYRACKKRKKKVAIMRWSAWIWWETQSELHKSIQKEQLLRLISHCWHHLYIRI